VDAILGLPNPFNGLGWPAISGTGYGTTYSASTPRKNVTNIYNGQENLTKTHGRHKIQFGGGLRFEHDNVLPQQQQEQYASTEVKTDNFYLEYPSKMQTGDALKDGNLTMNISHGGMQQTLTMLINDRKVEGQESITTPAGTWDCFKISYKCKMGIKTGPINIPINFEGTEWYAPGFGIVKTQSKYGGTAITSIK